MLDPSSSGSLALGLRAGVRTTAHRVVHASRQRWRHRVRRMVEGTVLVLFAVTLFALFVHNRMTPTRAADRPADVSMSGAEVYHINGFGIWVMDTGPVTDPVPIIVLHGGPGQSSEPLRDAFRSLEAHHRVIYYDQRGAGRSEVKAELSHYTVDQLVHELELLRRMVATTPRIRLLAHGFGGVVAQHYALSYPEHVESMVLLSSPPAEGVQYQTVFEYYDELWKTVFQAGIPPEDPAAADAWYARYWHRRAVAMLGDPAHASLLPDLHGSFAPARALNASLASMVRPHRLSRGRLAPRTLLVYGQEEAPCGPGEGLAPMVLRFANATLVTISGTGYWSFLEQPDLVHAHIKAFLGAAATR